MLISYLVLFGFETNKFNNFIENRMTKPVHETMNNPRIIFDQIFFQRKPLNEQQTDFSFELLIDRRYMYNAIL